MGRLSSSVKANFLPEVREIGRDHGHLLASLGDGKNDPKSIYKN